ncbi:MAG TPA: heme ABC exporter ATP-binding protein CcmA [Micropepsaceae bacterium]|nr:heme ABC exporter ATP-binding protein CcmA [Micropepsaceae bacterium]
MAFEAFSVRAEKLACARSGRSVFVGLSFEAGPGLTELRGRNGAGKSSLLRMIAGFIAPHSGTLSIMRNGAPFVDDEAPLAQFLAFSGHQDGLKNVMTPRETLAFSARYHGAIATIDHALDRLGLMRLADTPIQYLSAGQRKRVALARAFQMQKPLWLMDEPLSALDDDGRARVAGIIRAHVAQGGTIIAATHEPIDAAAARIVIGPAEARAA